MKKIFKKIKGLLCLLLLYSPGMVHAQLYVGNTGLVYISSGEQLYINGNMDVVNGGTVTHNATSDITVTGTGTLSGVMEYTAMGNQIILPFNHETIRVNGSGNKILSANINVNTILEFGGTAKLVTGNYVLALTGGSSSITGTAAFGNTATSWIVTGNGSAGIGNAGLGGLKIEGIGSTGRSGTILFPVGPTTSSYNPLTLINTGTTDDFVVTVNDQPVPGAPVLESINNSWNITETTAGASNVTLGTQWNVADEAPSFSRVICGVVHSNGTNIDSHAPAGAASGSNPYTKTGAGFNTFSPFGVTSNASILPVGYLNAEGFKKGAFVQVNWTTLSESPISYFEIEKSMKGNDFRLIGKLPVTLINNFTESSYSWQDQNPNTGNNFYRIRSVDAAGIAKYSNIVKVENAASSSLISIYPNPVVRNKLSLEFKNKDAGTYTISLVNVTGQVVFQQTLLHAGTNNAYTLQLPTALGKAFYQLNIKEPNNSNTKIKLIVDY